jgi:hypothetical protein
MVRHIVKSGTFGILSASYFHIRIVEGTPMNYQAAAPTTPSSSVSSQTRPRYGIAAECRSDDGQTFNELAVSVTSEGCRLAYYSDTLRPPVVQIQLRSPRGNVVQVLVTTSTVQEAGKLKVVNCRFERLLTENELAELL